MTELAQTIRRLTSGARSAATAMRRTWRQSTLDADEPTCRREWIEAYAVAHRPVLRAAESELVLLAGVVCDTLGIAEDAVPADDEAEQVHETVAEWVQTARMRAYDMIGKTQDPEL